MDLKTATDLLKDKYKAVQGSKTLYKLDYSEQPTEQENEAINWLITNYRICYIEKQ